MNAVGRGGTGFTAKEIGRSSSPFLFFLRIRANVVKDQLALRVEERNKGIKESCFIETTCDT